MTIQDRLAEASFWVSEAPPLPPKLPSSPHPPPARPASLGKSWRSTANITPVSTLGDLLGHPSPWGSRWVCVLVPTWHHRGCFRLQGRPDQRTHRNLSVKPAALTGVLPFTVLTGFPWMGQCGGSFLGAGVFVVAPCPAQRPLAPRGRSLGVLGKQGSQPYLSAL